MLRHNTINKPAVTHTKGGEFKRTTCKTKPVKPNTHNFPAKKHFKKNNNPSYKVINKTHDQT